MVVRSIDVWIPWTVHDNSYHLRAETTSFRCSTVFTQKQKRSIMKRINKVAILGAGTMGARIAAHFANAGVPSYLFDIVPPDADAPARNKIAAAGLDAAKKSKPAAFMEPSLARLVTVGNFEDD